MAINNPYIPGDPYSYDLKWLVRKIKEHDVILDGLDEKIQEAILEAISNLDQLGPEYFENVDGLLHSSLKDKALAYVEGFYTAGDGGANLYFVTTDYNDVLAADFYVTLDGPNRWAIPIIVSPYVTPIMFGAYGDGIEDDTAAFLQAMQMHKPVNLIAKTYLITDTMPVEDDLMTISNGTIKMNAETETGFIHVDQAEYVTIKDIYFEGSGVAMPTGSSGDYTAVQAYRADHLTIDNCSIKNVSNGGLFILESSYVTITNNTLSDFANRDAYGAIVVGYGINQIDMGFQTIQNNTIDGGHFGIECQGWQHDINISNNKTRNNYGYGIVLYRYQLDASSTFKNAQVIGNLVENTHHNTNVGYYNGMSIYAQTIDRVTISDNIVNNSMLDRPDAGSPNRTLSPGAISISGSEEVTCTGNVINNSVIDGIDVVDVSSDTIGNIVANNVINDAAVHGIHGQALQNVIVSGNIISGTSQEGILLLSHPLKETENVIIDSNIVRCVSGYGISVVKGTGTLSQEIAITNNTMTNQTARNMTVTDVEKAVITGNTMVANASVSNYAVYMNNVSSSVINGNMINGGTNYYYGGYYLSNVASSTFSSNVTKGVANVSEVYKKAGTSDITVTSCVDDLHTVPFSEGYAMHYSRTVAAPDFFSENMTPASGTHARGSIAFNTVPVAGQPIFWVCTVAGTPGTWVAGPTL